jgi:hypothetical protein
VTASSLTVVDGEELGRDWLRELNVDWQETKMEASDDLEGLLQQFAEVFSEELETYSGPPVHISHCPFQSVRRLRSRWTRCGRESSSQYHTRTGRHLIVAVLKSDKKSVELCADFKQTLNPAKMNKVNDKTEF